MNLSDIEKLIRKNSVIDEIPTFILRTSRDIEIWEDIGQITFVAIAMLYGFQEKEVCTHIDITHKRFCELFNRYKKANELCGNFSVKELYRDITKEKKIVAKIKMIKSAIEINRRLKRDYLPLDNLGY